MYLVSDYNEKLDMVTVLDTTDNIKEDYTFNELKKLVAKNDLLVFGLCSNKPRVIDISTIEPNYHELVVKYVCDLLISTFKLKSKHPYHYGYLDEDLFGVDSREFIESNGRLAMYSDTGREVQGLGVDLFLYHSNKYLILTSDGHYELDFNKIGITEDSISSLDYIDCSNYLHIHFNIFKDDIVALQDRKLTQNWKSLLALIKVLK